MILKEENSNSPIGDTDSVDIVGVRKDGGLDMVISCNGPIDDSDMTLNLLEEKIQNYINGALSRKFLEHYGRSIGAPVTICISCKYPIAQRAHKLIEQLQMIASNKGLNIEIRRQMEEVH